MILTHYYSRIFFLCGRQSSSSLEREREREEVLTSSSSSFINKVFLITPLTNWKTFESTTTCVPILSIISIDRSKEKVPRRRFGDVVDVKKAPFWWWGKNDDEEKEKNNLR